MPSLVPAELSVWMEDREKDLEEVVSTGDHSRFVVWSSMLHVRDDRQEFSDEYRSRTAPGQGRFALY